MSTINGEELFQIGVRLKSERVRLGLSQSILGTRLATTGRTIKKYEANETSIRATELLQFSGLGADVLYIVTGNRQPVDLAHPSTPSQRLATTIASLDLSDDDADLIAAMARRIASR